MPSTNQTPLSVLITRPEGQGKVLADELQALGLEALLFPTLEICPKQLSSSEQHCVEGLDCYSQIICVSANAAKIGLELLADYWPQWPVEQQWIAVGPATHDAMQGWGLHEVLLPEGASHSEGVLALDVLQTLDNQKILILRGVSGRELLAETLRERGATVDYLELYERKIPSPAPNILMQWLCSDAKKAIVVTSGDGLKNLLSLEQAAQRESGDRESPLFNIVLIVVSQRLAEFAKHKGFVTVWVADGAADNAIVACINKNNEP
ncbi:MAG: hypothetical protein COA99_08020 [Moraxellaceae bacterium]|nr:MAG: hypothetical protein COA99_08020 [Moraxellaceae bacterium]